MMNNRIIFKNINYFKLINTIFGIDQIEHIVYNKVYFIGKITKTITLL